MIVQNINTKRSWEEPITILDNKYRSKPLPIRTSIEEAKELAVNTVIFFNSRLRKNESLRKLIKVFFVKKHD